MAHCLLCERLEQWVAVPHELPPQLSGAREVAALMPGDLEANEGRVRQAIEAIVAHHSILASELEGLFYRELSSGKTLEEIVEAWGDETAAFGG